ncbi:MAG: hypothetical protein IPK75_12405 [Acidobacteria bacterium]|jgi:hypothetical protein|nr:hypothetical protein [Acidobacteriota bacterium]
MKKFAALLAASACLGSAAWAGTFIAVTDPAGSAGTAAIGINDHGEVSGSYTTDGVDMIGFTGSIDGVYETFSFDGHPTQGRGLNNSGTVTGYYVPDGQMNAFVRAPDGVLSPVTKDGAAIIGLAEGITNGGKFVGDYRTTPPAVPARTGFEGYAASYAGDVVLPFPAVRIAARGRNTSGDISGWFIAAAGEAPQGFLIKGGVTTVLTYPDPNTATFVEGLNDKGELSGSWVDMDGNSHGFALASDLVTWTSFDAPGASQTQAWQINKHGEIAVSTFNEATGASGSFVYCPGKGGLCAGKKGKPAKEKKSKSKEKLKKPKAGIKGVDPEAKSKGASH